MPTLLRAQPGNRDSPAHLRIHVIGLCDVPSPEGVAFDLIEAPNGQKQLSCERRRRRQSTQVKAQALQGLAEFSEHRHHPGWITSVELSSAESHRIREEAERVVQTMLISDHLRCVEPAAPAVADTTWP